MNECVSIVFVVAPKMHNIGQIVVKHVHDTKIFWVHSIH